MYKLIALYTTDYYSDFGEENLLELYFHSEENALEWIEDNRDDYQSFHYTILKDPPLKLSIRDIKFEDED